MPNSPLSCLLSKSLMDKSSVFQQQVYIIVMIQGFEAFTVTPHSYVSTQKNALVR